ncbi:SHOCT domain-containing protein [Vibrio diabolicus]
MEQLERLGVLREKGILTEEEFIQQKNKLLGQG